MKGYCFNCKLRDVKSFTLRCTVTNVSCPIEYTCDKWEDVYKDIRCDNWRECNMPAKRHTRYITLDRFCKYMKRKHNVWLLTSIAEPHDIVGGHIGW